MAYSSSMLRNTIAGLERADITPRFLLDGIVDGSMLGQEFWLPDDAYFEVLTRASRLSADPALGLSIGQRGGDWAGFGEPGLYILLVRSFSAAVEALVRFNRVTRDRQDLFRAQDEQTLSVQLGPSDAPLPARQLLAELFLAAVCELFRRFAGPRANPLAVWLDYPKPGHADEYYKLFGCHVQFDAPCSALVVARTLAEKQQPFFRPELAEQLERLAELRVTAGEAAVCIAERVRSCMRRGWQSDAPSMSVVARELGVSERSLRRHLASEGLHFRSILAESRLEVAREMLRNGVVVKQVAGELGYRSTSAFHRAFRRWAGATPVAFAAGEGRSR